MFATFKFQRFNLTRVNLHQRLALWLIVLLLLTKFSPVAALSTVLIVSLQVLFGDAIIARFSGFNQISCLSRVGLGFCVGATISTFAYVFVVTFTSVLVAVISQIILLVGALLPRIKQTSSSSSQATSEELAAVKWLAIVALMGLSPNWFWTLPVAIWLAASFLVWSRLNKSSIALKLLVVMLSVFSGLFVWLRIIATRPDRPWFADDRFAELFSFSLGKWGMSHNPMMVSENISYHWFSFAWIGAISNLAHTRVDLLFALFGPVIIAMTCAVLGYAIIELFISNTTIAICSLVFAVSVDTERLFEGYGFNAFQLSSFSQFFSLALGLALLLMIVALGDSQLGSVALIIGIVLAGLIGAKISSGLVATAGLGGVWLIGAIKRQPLLGKLRFLVVAIVAPGIFALVTFYGDPRNGSGRPFRRPGWPVGVAQNLWDLYNGSFARYLPILIFLTLAIGALGFVGLAIILKAKNNVNSFRNSQIFLGFGLIISLAQMWIRGGAGGKNLFEGNVSTLYAFHFWISLTHFIAIALAIQQFSILWRSQKLKKIIFVAGVSYLVALPLSRSWEIEYEPSYIVPLLTTFKPVLPLLIALLFAAVVFVIVRSRWQSFGFQACPNTFLVISNMALIVGGLFLFVSNYVDVSDRQQKEWRTMDASYSVSSDFIAATNWLKLNTPGDVIVASKVSRVSPRISVLTDRKEFAGVQASFRIFGEHSADYEKNYLLVDQFSMNGSCESASGLRDAEVGFFLVDLANSETPDISRCADEVFRNKLVVVYSLG